MDGLTDEQKKGLERVKKTIGALVTYHRATEDGSWTVGVMSPGYNGTGYTYAVETTRDYARIITLIRLIDALIYEDHSLEYATEQLLYWQARRKKLSVEMEEAAEKIAEMLQIMEDSKR